jgi:hypothetical protein
MAKAKKAPAKKAPAKPAPAPDPTETFTAHNTRRVLSESGTRSWQKVPAGTFTADLSGLPEDVQATVRKALNEL